jgi:hypothetical protein
MSDDNAKAIAASCANAVEDARATLANLPRGHVIREVSVQFLALCEEWLRAINADALRTRSLAAVERDRLARLIRAMDRWTLAKYPHPDHYGPRLQRHIARIRRRLRAD